MTKWIGFNLVLKLSAKLFMSPSFSVTLQPTYDPTGSVFVSLHVLIAAERLVVLINSSLSVRVRCAHIPAGVACRRTIALVETSASLAVYYENHDFSTSNAYLTFFTPPYIYFMDNYLV